jgi:beta-lactamase regulating signal transducer with metallopeptidase domain
MIEALNIWADAWAAFMVRATIDATLLLMLLAALWLPLRRRLPAQVGYCLFLLVIFKVLVPVVLPVPGWLAYLSPRDAMGQLVGTLRVPLTRQASAASTGPQFASSAGQLPPRYDESLLYIVAAAQLSADAQLPDAKRAARHSPQHHLSRTATLMLAWAAVVAMLSVRFAVAQRSMQRLLHQATPIDAAALTIDFEALRRLVKVRQPIRLVTSPHFGVPAVWGMFRPSIVLPPDLLKQLSGNQLTWVLLHELAHVRRGDLIVALVQRLTQIAHFFNPAIWIANRLIDQQREFACDDAALAASSLPRRDCGQGFLRVVELASSHAPALPALGFDGGLIHYKSFINRRLKRILDTRRPVQPRLTMASAALLLAIAAITLPHLKAQQPVAQPPATTPPSVGVAAPQAAAVAQKTELPPKLAYNCVVVDEETGQGIPNATVTVVWFSNRATGDSPIHLTDDQGRYTFHVPPDLLDAPGALVGVRVEHDGYVANPDSGSAYSLENVLTDEAQGRRPFFERIQLQPAVPLVGRVVSPEGTPLAGVHIRMYTEPNDRIRGNTSRSTFAEMRTDFSGAVRLKRIKRGTARLTFIRDDYAITELKLDDKASDLGDIRLPHGTRITGRALKADGQPAAGVSIDAVPGSKDSYEASGGWFSSISRSTTTDAEGRFTLAPLPAGQYRVESSKMGGLLPPSARNYQQADVFLAQIVTLVEGQPLMPLELRSVPQVVFHAQYLSSQGVKTEGHRLSLSGMIEDQFWSAHPEPTPDGTFDIRVPRGLNAHLMVTQSDESGLRIRRGKGQPLENYITSIDLGTLNDDLEGFEIIRYKAPVVMLKVTDEAGQPIDKLEVTGIYPGRKNATFMLKTGQQSGVLVERMDDGRYRTQMLLPDEDVTFEITAPGYQQASEKVKLKEGETKELQVPLKKASVGKQ